MTVDEIQAQIEQAPLTVVAEGLLGLTNPQWKALAAKVPQTDDERRKMIGARLRTVRELQGLTQREVAEKVGTSTALITTYETGTREPSLKKLIQLAKTLNFSTDWLLGLPPPKY